MNLSAKIKLRHPARQDGTCQILLQVIIGREVIPLSLKIAWPPSIFDETAGRCLVKKGPGYEQALALAGGTVATLERHAKDYNLIIGQALAKANKVFVEYRLSESPVAFSKGQFLQNYHTSGSRTDFVVYMEEKIKERHRRNKIGEHTRKNHTSTLNALKQFRPSIPFYTLTPDFADDFNDYLVRKVPGLNTRWGRHKDVKTYLALARKEKIKFEDPYIYFKNSSEPGKWFPLKPHEHQKLADYYALCAPHSPHRRVLAKFLFSCCSSLRLGDLKAIGKAKLDGSELRFEIQKTYSKKLKEMMLPLTNRALQYLHDARQEEGLPGFFDYTDQYENRMLTAIGQLLGIESRLHHHVGRETFATDFIRRGGKVEVLQKLMDHSNISTTMKYVHVDDDMKRAAIEAMNQDNETVIYESIE